MYNVPAARKVCATCKWWRGRRELDFAGARAPQFVRVENIRAEGNRCSAWKVERSSTHSCNRWTQWERM